MWLQEVFAPEVLIRHVAFFLLVVAMAMPGLFLLRAFALASGLVSILLAGFVAYDPVGLFWSVLLVAVLIIRLVLDRQRDQGKRLLPDERLFHEKVVPSLSLAETRKLLTAGQWRDVAAGTMLTRQGEIAPELCFLVRGTVDILVDGQSVAEAHPGSLIGEIGIATGDPAAATAVCASAARYLGFESGRLYAFLDRHSELQDAIELAVQRSFRDKIHRQHFAAAHVAGTARP